MFWIAIGLPQLPHSILMFAKMVMEAQQVLVQLALLLIVHYAKAIKLFVILVSQDSTKTQLAKHALILKH